MHSPRVEKLDSKAREIVDLYLALPIGTKPSCPYLNNRRHKSKSQLRVLRGKGSPAEIAEEAEILAKYSKIDIPSLSTDKLKQFLVSEGLGVDCSGFAYHVLNALSQEKKGAGIRKFIRSNRQGFVGKIMAKLRPAENMGVSTFRNDKNSFEIKVCDARPGDFITLIGTGKDRVYNHMMIITGVENQNGETRLSYAHSYAWPSDGTVNHGVREGHIIVHGDDILGGTWKENGFIGNGNYTFESAKGAKEVSIRRPNFMRQ